MNRLLELASSVDAHLRQFGAVDLRREPYSWESPDAQPSGPSLYINGVKDKALMNLPTTGKAVVEYRIKRRSINEDNRDGVPTYGADIDVFSIEDYEEEEEEGETGFSALERFINFADRDRNEQGQFAPGSSVSPENFRIAGVAMKKKKVAAAAAGVAGAAGIAATLSPQVRAAAGRVGKGMVSGAGRMLLRR